MSTVIRNYFKFQPNRDDALARIYAFLNAIADNNPEEAQNLVLCDKPIVSFLNALNEHILNHVTLYMEDNELLINSDNYLSFLDKPSVMNEKDILPLFSGTKFVVETGELISVCIGIKGYITNIRIYFILEEYDAIYYLRLKYIKKDNNV